MTPQTYIGLVDGELTIVFERAEEGGYTAFIPEVPGVASEGETIEEARDMVLDALHGLAAFRREMALNRMVPGTLVERIITNL